MKIAPFDYLITPDALEIHSFGHCIWRLLKSDIVNARVQPMTALFDGVTHPFSTMRLGNRFQRDYIIIERCRWPRFIAITPKEPAEFLTVLFSS